MLEIIFVLIAAAAIAFVALYLNHSLFSITIDSFEDADYEPKKDND